MQPQGFYKNLFDLSGKVALVTGATGILGKHFTAALADHGASVAVLDTDQQACDEHAAFLREQYNIKAIGVACDIRQKRNIRQAIEKVNSNLGHIDILHSNAATKTSNLKGFFACAEQYSEETWKDVMSVNLDGAFYLIQEVGAQMAQRAGGSIIQTASVYGVIAPDQGIYDGAEYLGTQINLPPVYTASKAATIGMTKYWASYWGKQKVRVNTISPGGVESGQNDRFKENYGKKVMLGRMSEIEEVVGALVFLASNASSYITGQNIIIDGGFTAW